LVVPLLLALDFTQDTGPTAAFALTATAKLVASGRLGGGPAWATPCAVSSTSTSDAAAAAASRDAFAIPAALLVFPLGDDSLSDIARHNRYSWSVPMTSLKNSISSSSIGISSSSNNSNSNNSGVAVTREATPASKRAIADDDAHAAGLGNAVAPATARGVVRAFAQCLEAVAHLHARGLAHGHLTPDAFVRFPTHHRHHSGVSVGGSSGGSDSSSATGSSSASDRLWADPDGRRLKITSLASAAFVCDEADDDDDDDDDDDEDENEDEDDEVEKEAAIITVGRDRRGAGLRKQKERLGAFEEGKEEEDEDGLDEGTRDSAAILYPQAIVRASVAQDVWALGAVRVNREPNKRRRTQTLACSACVWVHAARFLGVALSLRCWNVQILFGLLAGESLAPASSSNGGVRNNDTGESGGSGHSDLCLGGDSGGDGGGGRQIEGSAPAATRTANARLQERLDDGGILDPSARDLLGRLLHPDPAARAQQV
jgi:serine/threonine protein kinase